MGTSERFRVGIALERKRIAHPWQEWRWRVAAVIPGAPEIAQPRLMREDEGSTWYHMATLDIEIHRNETEGYRLNLSQAQPIVYALWRSDPSDADGRPNIFHVTVCPYEAEDYLDGGDATVEGAPMPGPVVQWLADYVSRHHHDQPFEKRQRQPFAPMAEDDIG